MVHREAVQFGLGLAVVVGVASAGMWTAEAPVLLGSEGAEVYGHAWVQWWMGAAWPTLPSHTGLLNPPKGVDWSVIDPATTWLAAGLGQVLGAQRAYNAVILAGVATAWCGGWVLGRRTDGAPWVCAAVLALAPIFAGSLASGLTEDAALGVLALALAWLSTATGEGSWDERGRWRAAVLAGAALGALPWLGLYLALLGAGGATVLGLAALGRGPRKGARWARLALAAGLALALTAPAALRQGDRLTGVGHRAGHHADRPEPHWRVNPWRAADLAAFWTPGPDRDDGALIRLHPTYLGWVALGLAVLGGRRRGSGRWWVLAGGTLVLSLGPELRWAGHTTGVPNPVVQLAEGVPLVGLVNHWGRLWLLGHVALAVLAGRGAQTLIRRAPQRLHPQRWAVGLGMAAAVEYVVLSPAPWPLPVADAAIPEVYTELGALPEGAVVVVPSAGPGVPFQRPLYRQRGHGRPLMLHPNQPGYGRAREIPLLQYFAALGGDRRDPPEPSVAFSRRRLFELGVGALVVEDPWVEEAMAVLGPPDVRASGGAAWGLRDPEFSESEAPTGGSGARDLPDRAP